MRFNANRFNRHLNHIGEQFEWRKAFSCPCRQIANKKSGAADPKCANCKGIGYIWAGKVPALCGVSGQKTQLQWQQFGQYMSGDVVLTIQESSPMYEMGQFDRVLMLNSTDYFSEVRERGSAIEKLYQPVQKVTRVYWLNDQGAIIEAGIPAVAEDGAISFASDAPPTGKKYSITGTSFSEYFCWGPFTSDRAMHSGARLPRKVVLRKFDLFGRSSS